MQWFDPFDHVVKDLFPGLDDVKAGKATLFAPDGVRLISEYDDMQAMNLQVRFGMPTGNVFGNFVSGTTFSRRENSGTAFFYEQAARG